MENNKRMTAVVSMRARNDAMVNQMWRTVALLLISAIDLEIQPTHSNTDTNSRKCDIGRNERGIFVTSNAFGLGHMARCMPKMESKSRTAGMRGGDGMRGGAAGARRSGAGAGAGLVAS